MRTRLPFSLFFNLTVIILLSSCIKATQKITLSKDGSAIIHITFNIPPEKEKFLRLTQPSFFKSKKQKSDSDINILDELQVRKNLLQNHVGIDIISLRYYRRQRFYIYEIKIAVDNLASALKQNFLPGMYFEEYKPNQWVFLWKPPYRESINFPKDLLKGLDLSVYFFAPQTTAQTKVKKQREKAVIWQINEKNFVNIIKGHTVFSTLVQGDYSYEKQLLNEEEKKKFFGLEQ